MCISEIHDKQILVITKDLVYLKKVQLNKKHEDSFIMNSEGYGDKSLGQLLNCLKMQVRIPSSPTGPVRQI